MRTVQAGLMEVVMAARKRASTRSKLLNRAVKAGRSAFREAQRRVPPDVRKQIERTVEDGQKTMHTAIRQVQARLDRTARQADLDRAMKRLEELTKQVRNLAAGTVASATATRPARRKPATRNASTRKATAPKPAARKPAASAAPKRTAQRSPRARKSPPPSPAPGPERTDTSF
jgi:polyhydroxyalkanoate synthesis regulator phasin